MVVVLVLIACALVVASLYWVARLSVGAIAELLPRPENLFTCILRIAFVILLFAAICGTAWGLFHGHAGASVCVGGVLLLLLATRRGAFHF